MCHLFLFFLMSAIGHAPFSCGHYIRYKFIQIAFKSVEKGFLS